MFSSKTLDPNSIAINDIIVEENVISISGSITDSAISFKDYKINNKNNKLYIEIRGKSINFGKKDGTFNIKVDSEKYGDISEIYFTNSDESETLKIWPK